MQKSSFELVSGICRDPHDDMFLAVAATGCAHNLVTEDLDLLVLKNSGKTLIVTAAEFLLSVSEI